MTQVNYTSEEFLEKLLLFFRFNKENEIVVFEGRKVISFEQVKALFEEVIQMSEKECTLYYKVEGKSIAEIAIADDIFLGRRDSSELLLESKDEENKISYEIGQISDNYIVWIFKEVFQKYPVIDRPRDRFLLILRQRLIRLKRSLVEGEDICLLNIMRAVVFSSSLKVLKENSSTVSLESAIDSYSYTFMRNMQTPIKVYSIEEIVGISDRKEIERNPDFEPPKRKYNSNLIDYYNLAVSSHDPFISFISYYHIIEYFYEEVYIEHQINSLRLSITAPNFSYKNNEQLYAVIKKINKNSNEVRENGSGNELQSLNYVLLSFINDLEEFKARLKESELDYCQNISVTFSGGNKIHWDDTQNVLKHIAKRIYYTRNSLVHSKSTKKHITYHPHLHKLGLSEEIPLIKAIAEHIIEKDSEIM